MSERRWDNPRAVIVEIDARGWPMVTVVPRAGRPVEALVLQPEGNAQWVEDRSHIDPIWSKR